MIDTKDIPASLYDADLPTPNIYYVTVNSAIGGVHHLYVAADTSKAAAAKVKRHCREQLGFVAIRSTCDTKMRRFRLGDYLENPDAIAKARDMAVLANERSTVLALDNRHNEVANLIADIGQMREEEKDLAWAQLEAQLGAELRQAS